MKPDNGKAPAILATTGSSGQMTVTEMARLGGLARAQAYSKAQIRAWGRQGGRPASLDGKAVARVQKLLRAGKSQADCARACGVSVRTIGRAVARMEKDESTL